MKIVAFVLFVLAPACASIKPYEKEYLLSPVMDDAKTAKLNSSLLPATISNFEKLSSLGAGGASATACPTCGGG
jgi:hypothetical protein